MDSFDSLLAGIDAKYAVALSKYSIPVANYFKLQHIPTHAPSFVFSLILFQSTYILGGLLSPYFSAHYADTVTPDKLSKKTRYQWRVRCVSQVNSILLVWLSIRCLGLEDVENDRAFGWDARIGRVCALACGYFFWDILETLYANAGLPFLIHGLACFCIFGMGFRPFIAYYGVRCLFWEASTPFLNIHWWLDKTERTGSSAQLINGIILLLTFFSVRIVYGSYVTFQFWQTVYSVRSQFSTTALLIYFVGNGALNVLNWIWLSKMINALLKRFDNDISDEKKKPIATGNGSSVKKEKQL